MGTNNFGRANASKIFAVLMNIEEKFSECEECGEKAYEYQGDYIEEGNVCSCGCAEIEHDTEYRSAEQWEFDDLKANILSEISTKREGLFYYREVDDRDGNLFYLQIDKDFGDTNIDVKVYGTIEDGYYEGAMLDWRIEYDGDNDTLNFEEHFEYHSEMNAGMQKIQRKNAEKWAEKMKDQMINLIESVFETYSIQLERVATFSNGETIYRKI